MPFYIAAALRAGLHLGEAVAQVADNLIFNTRRGIDLLLLSLHRPQVGLQPGMALPGFASI